MEVLTTHNSLADAALSSSSTFTTTDDQVEEKSERKDNEGTKGTIGFWDWFLLGLLSLGLAVLVYFSIRNAFFQPLLTEAKRHQWTTLFLRPAVLWAVMGTALFAFRTVCWFRYRSFPPAVPSEALSLTVVIPAYNEGSMVLQSIESVATAFYPPGRLKIFVVDDGSTDDTWRYIQQATTRYPDLVEPIRLSQNRGKRTALASAFAKARSEIIVTLDSDSVIEPKALLAIVGPFRDSKIGAVAGKVAVYNRSRGLIPRMLHVRYILSFDLLRAVESSYRNVYCCPGALTAYRASVVHNVREQWLQQTFLGSRCTFGEDRAMTNMILESGYDTVYQRAAVVHTVVPINYWKMCKMFIRWDRSYVREELRFLRIVWKRPLRTRLIALCDRLITNARYPVHYVSLALLVSMVATHPPMLFRILLVVGMTSFFNTLYYLRSEQSLDFFYGILYSYFAMLTLFWIFPYALFTVRARAWLTR